MTRITTSSAFFPHRSGIQRLVSRCGVRCRPALRRWTVRGGRGAMVTVALLAKGVTSRQADAELLAMSDSLRQTSRLRTDQLLVTDRPLQQRAMDRYKPALFAMLGAVMLVLMMAAINVVNLLLVRGSARAGECAILAALGASRAGLAARAVAEAVALALVGAGRGLVLARALLAAIAAIQPEQLSFLSGSTPTLTPLVVSLTVLASDVHLRSRQWAPGVARHPRGPRRCSAAPIPTAGRTRG